LKLSGCLVKLVLERLNLSVGVIPEDFMVLDEVLMLLIQGIMLALELLFSGEGVLQGSLFLLKFRGNLPDPILTDRDFFLQSSLGVPMLLFQVGNLALELVDLVIQVGDNRLLMGNISLKRFLIVLQAGDLSLETAPFIP
jgi:hypothetical protein